MGRGIAQVCAMAGHNVRIRDVDESILENSFKKIKTNLEKAEIKDKLTAYELEETLENISLTTNLEESVVDVEIVIEAVPEDIELKKNVFSEIEPFVSEDTLITTNTSSLPVTEISRVLDNPSRSIGLHFFNPVYIMDLVEVVVPEQADKSTINRSRDFVRNIEKNPILISDSPGFASSRLGVTLGIEAIRMLQEGVADPSDIDQVMKIGYNHPMGPLELTDLVGLDVRLEILEHLREELGERFRPPQLLRKKVRAGKLGKKTGEGIYIWEDGEPIDVSNQKGD